MGQVFPDGEGAGRQRAPGPIRVETAVFRRVVEPVAYPCVKLMLVREGTSLVHCAHGRIWTRAGTLVVVCAGTLCGAISDRRVRVSTVYVSVGYVLDQLMWRLNGLLMDRHEAEVIAVRRFRHNMWGTQLGPELAGRIGLLLDRVEQAQDGGGWFYAIEALFAEVLGLVVPIPPPDRIRTLPIGTAVILLRSTPPIITDLNPWPNRHDATHLKRDRANIKALLQHPPSTE